jgi:pimeloyl-ACP methyl ester carboxylesterase
VTSPCEQSDEDEGRACGSGTKDYDEYQALISLPIFQQGDAPYLREGGAISDQVERHEDVCMSLSVPKSAAPPQGYPLVIYGHGTGGGFRSQLRPEVAGRLATGGSAFATLAFDQVQHGPRRGDGEGSDQEPDTLFFNFVNPEAARGNPLQGAADVLSMIAFAQSGQLASAADTGGVALNVDPTKIFLFGHSQGSTHSSMALPFSDLPGGVFSGNGGGLVEALLAKKNPVDIASAIPLVVQDVDTEGNLRMGDKHPVLALLQHYIDPADPVNFAPLLATRPEDGNSAKSVFQTFGLNDTYAPPKTLARYIYAAEKMELAKPPAGVSPAGDNVLRLDAQSEPVSGNVGEDPELSTLVCRQYEPQGDSDGHFVIFDVSDATDDVIGFFDALGDGDVPTVPAP